MSLTAMTHEDHGTHICYTDAEVKACESVGWKKDPALSRSLSGEPMVEKSLVDKYVEKFGVKPHHRMSAETIQAKLDEKPS